MKTTRSGFTLIELLLVIGIIAILAAIVIVAINPSKQLGDARDAQRRSDVNTILNAYWQYAIDNSGDFQPTGTPGACDIPAAGEAGQKICNIDVDGTDCVTHTCVLSRHLSGTYVVGIPSDPSDDSTAGTEANRVDYVVRMSGTDRLQVYGSGETTGTTISATR